MNVKVVETYAASVRRASSGHKLQNVASAAPVNLENVQDFGNVCRLCATITELVIPIFGGEGLENNLAEKICKHLPIKVRKQDALPLVVCYQCASTLLAWHELVQCSLQADAALRRRLAALAALSLVTTEPKSSNNTSETSEKSSQTKARSVRTGEVLPCARPQRVDAATSPAPTALTRACDFCSLECQKRGYNDHLLNAHPDQVFRCDECHSYVDKKELLYHMSDHAYQYVVIKNGIKKDRKNTRKLLIIDDQNKQSQATPSQINDKKTAPRKEKAIENEFSDHSDSECFGSVPQSVLEAINDSLDSPSRSDNDDSLQMITENETDSTSNVHDANTESDGKETENTSKAKDEMTSERKSRNTKTRTCPICSKEYKASSSYFYHMKYFHKRSREHACDVCDKKFGTKANLNQHASIHTGECALECTTCKKRFRSKASLYIHEQTHSGVKTFKCPQCSKCFRWRTHLARHVTRHGGAKGHVCEQCGRGFSVRCDLLRHARTHAAARLDCDHCSVKFAQLRYLKVHMLKKHSANHEPTKQTPS